MDPKLLQPQPIESNTNTNIKHDTDTTNTTQSSTIPSDVNGVIWDVSINRSSVLYKYRYKYRKSTDSDQSQESKSNNADSSHPHYQSQYRSSSSKKNQNQGQGQNNLRKSTSIHVVYADTMMVVGDFDKLLSKDPKNSPITHYCGIGEWDNVAFTKVGAGGLCQKGDYDYPNQVRTSTVGGLGNGKLFVGGSFWYRVWGGITVGLLDIMHIGMYDGKHQYFVLCTIYTVIVTLFY